MEADSLLVQDLITMDTIFPTLACYLLVLSLAVAQIDHGNTTVTPTITAPDLNLTHTTTMVTLPNSTVHATVISNLTENTTPFTNMTPGNETFTNTTTAAAESTSQPQTSQSTTIMTPLTNSTSPKTSAPGTHTPTSTAMTTSAMQTTGGFTNTSDSTVFTTANSSHTVNTTTESLDRTTQALRLNSSEKNMTILFSVFLGVFAMSLVVLMFYKCKHKIQYLHQPLNNTDDTDAFVADDDTLVISGGLYDGHPIYDNVPTASADQSQFRLQFLH
ncbi:integumentary mucin A.1 isoform X3 [Larimichthys crocea]|uniref:integumentary mucin A.1 isoform X3 n=1 Tax=Larimichthys crocea TaxID=215358 RepID=UPI000F5F0430|nr:integumentary mucin A.1 isoform X3 [Larimichthys crocea]